MNATATKYVAVEGEPHWTTDKAVLYIFNSTECKPILPLNKAITNNGDVVCHSGDIVYNI